MCPDAMGGSCHNTGGTPEDTRHQSQVDESFADSWCITSEFEKLVEHSIQFVRVGVVDRQTTVCAPYAHHPDVAALHLQ